MDRILLEITPHAVASDSTTSIPESADSVLDVLPSRVRPSAMNLLVLSYRVAPDAWFRRWKEQVETLPDEVGFVRIGGLTRATTASNARNTGARTRRSPVATLSRPDDVTGLKDAIRRYVADWEDNDRRTVVYLDSVVALVRSVGLETAHRFLHTLTGRVRSIDGYGYYGIDRRIEIRERVKPLFAIADNRIGVTGPTPKCRKSHE